MWYFDVFIVLYFLLVGILLILILCLIFLFLVVYILMFLFVMVMILVLLFINEIGGIGLYIFFLMRVMSFWSIWFVDGLMRKILVEFINSRRFLLILFFWMIYMIFIFSDFGRVICLSVFLFNKFMFNIWIWSGWEKEDVMYVVFLL